MPKVNAVCILKNLQPRLNQFLIELGREKGHAKKNAVYAIYTMFRLNCLILKLKLNRHEHVFGEEPKMGR